MEVSKPPVQTGLRFRHEKTGGVYTVLTTGIIEADLTPCVVYRDDAGMVWVRPTDEFNDGRFTCID